MNNFAKMGLVLSIAATVLGGFSPQAAKAQDAQTRSFTKASLDFSAPQPYTAEQFAKLKANSVLASSLDQRQLAIGPMAAKLTYSFTDLYAGHFINSKDSFSTTSKGTVYLTLTQSPMEGSSGTADIYYTLYDGSQPATNSVEVPGNYTSTNKTIYWSQVPAGTYKLVITNSPSGVDSKGNGFAN